MEDLLQQHEIAKYLKYPEITPVVLEKTVSTNSLLRDFAKEGKPEGTFLLTDWQTGGRGRHGQTFYSPCKTGLYMSLLLRPPFDFSKAVYLTTACAVCAAEAVEQFGASPGIKWVNDLYLDGKKVAGILTEAVEGCVIVGIGLNLYAPKEGFPNELSSVAGHLFPQEVLNLKNRLAAEWANRFWEEYRHLDVSNFIARYRERSILPGKTVDVLRADGNFAATVKEINDRCELVVETFDGKCLTLSSGEVSIRLQKTLKI